MSSTLDSICTNIDTRFTTLSSIFDIYSTYELDDEDDSLLKQSIRDLEELKDTYLANTIDILSEYYSTDDDNKKDIRNSYIRAFHSCNIVGELDRLYKTYVKLKKIYHIADENLLELAKLYD